MQEAVSTTCNVTITEPAEDLTCSAVETTSVDCRGNATGVATVTPNGGTAPYTYLWDVAAGSQTSATATGLAAGTYTVTVTDARGCTTTCNVTITEPAEDLTCSAVETTSVDCRGNATGVATVTPNGGTAPYTYLWDVAAGSQTSAIASNLAAGTYSVTVTDARGCTTTCNVTITEPAEDLTCSAVETTSVDCRGNATGEWRQ